MSKLKDQPNGDICVVVNHGKKKWFFGLLPGGDDVSPCFGLEWFGGYASIIFHDDNWSEYRGVDKDNPVQICDDIRRKIAHGELTPHPVEECMPVNRAFDAAIDSIKNGTRPNWLHYNYVA